MVEINLISILNAEGRNPYMPNGRRRPWARRPNSATCRLNALGLIRQALVLVPIPATLEGFSESFRRVSCFLFQTMDLC